MQKKKKKKKKRKWSCLSGFFWATHHTFIAKSTLHSCINAAIYLYILLITYKFSATILNHNHDIFKNFRLTFLQLVKTWYFLKVATFLWSLLWLLNGLPHNSLPHSHLKNGGMRLKTKWLKTELSTRFWFFNMCCKDIVTSCFTSLKSLLINFYGLSSRYWPWLLWHNLLHLMSYLHWKQYTVWFLDF